jgi:hypothetical protein
MLAGFVIVVAAVASVRKSIEHKPLLLHNPFMTDAERHRVRLGGLYDLANVLNGLEPDSRVGGVPRMIAYHVDSHRLATMAWAPLPSPSGSRGCQYDYVVVAPPSPAEQNLPYEETLEPVFATADGYRLFRVLDEPAEGIAPPAHSAFDRR